MHYMYLCELCRSQTTSPNKVAWYGNPSAKTLGLVNNYINHQNKNIYRGDLYIINLYDIIYMFMNTNVYMYLYVFYI